jgi:hypothetical protein
MQVRPCFPLRQPLVPNLAPGTRQLPKNWRVLYFKFDPSVLQLTSYFIFLYGSKM